MCGRLEVFTRHQDAMNWQGWSADASSLEVRGFSSKCTYWASLLLRQEEDIRRWFRTLVLPGNLPEVVYFCNKIIVLRAHHKLLKWFVVFESCGRESAMSVCCESLTDLRVRSAMRICSGVLQTRALCSVAKFCLKSLQIHSKLYR